SPTAIDVDAFALQNAFRRSYPEPFNGLVALVNIGHETTNLSLMENGQPSLVRDLPFGSRRLRESLQRERGLTSDRAESVLQGRENGVELRPLIEERIDELAVGIERAVAVIVAQSGGEGLNRVF